MHNHVVYNSVLGEDWDRRTPNLFYRTAKLHGIKNLKTSTWTLNLYSPLKMRNHVSHMYETRNTVKVFFILILRFLYGRAEGEHFQISVI